MEPSMFPQLFNVPALRMFRADIGKEGSYEHSFGGQPRHEGVTFADFPPAHLLFTFDLSDTRLGVSIPGVRRLPIYHAFRGIMCYRALTDDKIEMLNEPYREANPQSEYLQGFPQPFQQMPIDVVELEYDPRNADDVYYYGSIYGTHGIDILTSSEKSALKSQLEKHHEKLFGEKLLDDAADNWQQPYKALDIDMIANFSIFPQGTGRNTCPNKCCPNSKAPGSLHMLFCLSFLENESNEHSSDDYVVLLYKELAGADGGVLIYELCPLCQALRVTLQCT
jgi:hypothetical protein